MPSKTFVPATRPTLLRVSSKTYIYVYMLVKFTIVTGSFTLEQLNRSGIPFFGSIMELLAVG